jgi:hypothetical protein
MTRKATLGLLLFVTLVAGAQTPQTHTAPPPSVKFPARWYRSDNTIVSTEAPVKGVPYSATMFTTYTLPGADGQTKDTTDEGGAYYRDGKGRTRTEEVQGGRHFLPDGSVEKSSRRIEVNDTVSHCHFRWVEPWQAPGPPTAEVDCMSRTVRYGAQDRFAWLIAQTPSEDSRGQNKPLGHSVIEGLDTVGAQRTDSSHSLVTEFWYSSQLHELLRFGPVPHNAGLPTFELKNVHLGEPDPKLFYPPSNYRIVKPGEATP